MNRILLQIHPTDPLVCLAVVATALAACVVVRRWITRKRQATTASPPMTLSQQRVLERDITNLLAELSQMAQNITQQLDTRAKTLDALLKQADEKITALRNISAAPHSRLSANDPDIAPDAIPEVFAPTDSPDPRHADVYTLADQGRTSQQIAQHLNRPNGEIELILALRPRA